MCPTRRDQAYAIKGTVINLFRDQNKSGKIFFAMLADRKGNFGRERSRGVRTNFRTDHAIAQMRSGSHRARSQIFAPQRNSPQISPRAIASVPRGAKEKF